MRLTIIGILALIITIMISALKVKVEEKKKIQQSANTLCIETFQDHLNFPHNLTTDCSDNTPQALLFTNPAYMCKY